MIRAVSSQIPGPYQSFENTTTSHTSQKIVEVALIAIAALGMAAAWLILPPVEGLLVAMVLGGFASIVAASFSVPAYWDPVYIRREPELPFYSRWFYPVPSPVYRPPLFVNDPVVRAPLPRVQAVRPSNWSAPRVRVGGGHVHSGPIPAPFRQSGPLEGARVRVGERR